MSILFTVKEETIGRWCVYRDLKPLIKQLTPAQAINDARELARMTHSQSDEAVTVAFETPETSILLARHVLPTSTHLSSARTAAV